METQYSLSETDYVNGIKLAAVATRKQLIWLSIGGLGLLMLGIFGPDRLKGVGYFGLFFGALGYFITLYVLSPWQAKRHYKNYKAIQAPLHIAMIEGGFSIRTENGHNNAKWVNLLKWRENGGYILVYFAPKLCYVVPKRIATLGFDLDHFRKQLTMHLGDPI